MLGDRSSQCEHDTVKASWPLVLCQIGCSVLVASGGPRTLPDEQDRIRTSSAVALTDLPLDADSVRLSNEMGTIC